MGWDGVHRVGQDVVGWVGLKHASRLGAPCPTSVVAPPARASSHRCPRPKSLLLSRAPPSQSHLRLGGHQPSVNQASRVLSLLRYHHWRRMHRRPGSAARAVASRWSRPAIGHHPSPGHAPRRTNEETAIRRGCRLAHALRSRTSKDPLAAVREYAQTGTTSYGCVKRSESLHPADTLLSSKSRKHSASPLFCWAKSRSTAAMEASRLEAEICAAITKNTA